MFHIPNKRQKKKKELASYKIYAEEEVNFKFYPEQLENLSDV